MAIKFATSEELFTLDFFKTMSRLWEMFVPSSCYEFLCKKTMIGKNLLYQVPSSGCDFMIPQ